ncbi:MAG: hypothetical protein JWM07_602 [Candidatus Saccharibacteria bacterium]|jgi:hypothetical protein|nr:hypothetical protein [Candidatus Saccharibacteria bacterium]
MNPTIPTDPTTPPAGKNTKLNKRTLLIVIGSLLLVAAAFVAYILMQQNRGTDHQGSAIVDQEHSKPTNTDDISVKLPNGKTATYKNTEGNRNIAFADSDKGMEYVALSHKEVERFLSSADQEIMTRLCGADGERADVENIVLANMSTKVRMIEYSTESNCLSELATMRNSDTQLRTDAAALIQRVEDDIKAFYSAVIIK